jgi:hypothetical protein
VSPSFGKVSGGEQVNVILPLDFAFDQDSTEVFFIGDSSGNPAAKAKKVEVDPENPWFLTCKTPPSHTGGKQVVHVVLTGSGTRAPPSGGWPPAGSAVLENAYTYIDPLADLDFLARRAYPFGPLVDPQALDYDGDGWMDIVGLVPEKNALVFVKNDGQGEFIRDKFRPLGWNHPKHPNYTGLVAGNVNGDSLDDMVVFGQHGFLLLLNRSTQPGSFEPKLSNDFRRGISGTLKDLNRDGYGDLILGGIDAVRIFGFIPQIQMFTSHPIQLETTLEILGVAAADIDNDGDFDIVSTTETELIWYQELGVGIYGTAQTMPVKSLSSKHGVRRIITADLNMDSNQDVVYTAADRDQASAPYPEGVVGVLLANGAGGFNQPVDYPVTGVGFGLTGATDVETMDVDQDGNPDIMAAVASRNAAVFFKGDGAGGLVPHESFGVGMEPRFLAALDLEKDGVMDLVVSEPGTKRFSFLEGIQMGGGDHMPEGSLFQCGMDIPLDIQPDRIAVLDVNNDGIHDLVAIQRREGMIAILLNDGGGGFTPHQDLPVSGDLLECFCMFQANENEDAYPDIAVVVSNQGNPGALTVYLNDGNGSFAQKQTQQTAPRPLAVRAGDVNNKGNQDLVLVEFGADSCTVFKGDGSGLFDFFIQRDPIPGPQGVTLADLDNDFDLDAVVPAPGHRSLYLLPSDKDGAGILALVPGKARIQIRTRPTIAEAADFNLDGFPDMAVNGLDESIALILHNDGFLNFTGGAPIPLSGPASSLRAIDINFDHQPDLCVPVPAAAGLDVLLNQNGALSKIGFSPLPVNGFFTDAPPVWVDLNGDVLPDLVMPSHREKKITILFNQSK